MLNLAGVEIIILLAAVFAAGVLTGWLVSNNHVPGAIISFVLTSAVTMSVLSAIERDVPGGGVLVVMVVLVFFGGGYVGEEI